MRTILITLSALLATILMSSCFKVWTCTCNTTYHNPDSLQLTGGLANIQTTAPRFKSKAKKECDEQARQFTDSIRTTRCTLK